MYYTSSWSSIFSSNSDNISCTFALAAGCILSSSLITTRRMKSFLLSSGKAPTSTADTWSTNGSTPCVFSSINLCNRVNRSVTGSAKTTCIDLDIRDTSLSRSLLSLSNVCIRFRAASASDSNDVIFDSAVSRALCTKVSSV